MEEFDKLLEVAKILNSPGGCPWDQTQTFETLREYVLEEAHEVLEAVDIGDDQELIEELGDLLYTVIFYSKVAERENRFTIKDILDSIQAKLIRRHPHVFGEEKADSIDDVLKTWSKVKAEEKKDRKSALDGIPKTLPSLQRAQKMLGRIKKNEGPLSVKEEGHAEEILKTVVKAHDAGVDIESAFRTLLSSVENDFKAWEDGN